MCAAELLSEHGSKIIRRHVLSGQCMSVTSERRGVVCATEPHSEARAAPPSADALTRGQAARSTTCAASLSASPTEGSARIAGGRRQPIFGALQRRVCGSKLRPRAPPRVRSVRRPRALRAASAASLLFLARAAGTGTPACARAAQRVFIARGGGVRWSLPIACHCHFPLSVCSCAVMEAPSLPLEREPLELALPSDVKPPGASLRWRWSSPATQVLPSDVPPPWLSPARAAPPPAAAPVPAPAREASEELDEYSSWHGACPAIPFC